MPGHPGHHGFHAEKTASLRGFRLDSAWTDHARRLPRITPNRPFAPKTQRLSYPTSNALGFVFHYPVFGVITRFPCVLMFSLFPLHASPPLVILAFRRMLRQHSRAAESLRSQRLQVRLLSGIVSIVYALITCHAEPFNPGNSWDFFHCLQVHRRQSRWLSRLPLLHLRFEIGIICTPIRLVQQTHTNIV